MMNLKSKITDVKTIGSLLTGAEAEARTAGDAEPGAEHLLLSAFDLPDGAARGAFERIGMDPDGFRRAVVAVHDEALRASGIEPPGDDDLGGAPPAHGAYRMTASGRAAFDAAGTKARADERTGLTGAHVVFAVAQMEHGTAPRALRYMGIDRDKLAEAAEAEIDRLRSSGP